MFGYSPRTSSIFSFRRYFMEKMVLMIHPSHASVERRPPARRPCLAMPRLLEGEVYWNDQEVEVLGYRLIDQGHLERSHVSFAGEREGHGLGNLHGGDAASATAITQGSRRERPQICPYLRKT